MKTLITILSVLTLLLSAVFATAGQSYDDGDILVKFKPGAVNLVSTLSDMAQNGGNLESLGGDWYHVTVAPMTVNSFGGNDDLLATLRANPDVEYAQPNYRLKLIEDYSKAAENLSQGEREFLNGAPFQGFFGKKPDLPAASIIREVGPDPLVGQQWAVKAIHADEAWKTTRGSKKIIVAVIDTGIDYLHEDLVANLWHNPGESAANGRDNDQNGYVDDEIGWDFSDNDNKPYDVTASILGTLFAGGNPGHGTHCAGTIGAVGNNTIGISGVSPNVSIMPLRFIGKNGQGTTAQAIKAINYAVHNGAKILSNSWGSEGDDPREDNHALKDAIKDAGDHNVLFIAAAGNGHSGIGYDNDTDPKPGVPASYDIANIISVAAVDQNGKLAPFSNWGLKTVHIAAPGVEILSTMVRNRYSDSVFKFGSFKIPWDGTSMATPFVAGAAALVWAAHPEYTALQVKAKLLSTATQLPSLEGKVVSGGEVNVAAAVK